MVGKGRGRERERRGEGGNIRWETLQTQYKGMSALFDYVAGYVRLFGLVVTTWSQSALLYVRPC